MMIASEVVTLAATVKKLSSTKYDPYGSFTSTHAVLTVESEIRYLISSDGLVQPDASIGHKSSDGDVIILENTTEIQNFRAFATGGAAVIQASYYENYQEIRLR